MGDISFRSDGEVIFPTKHHGEVTLSRRKWDEICKEPERFFYRYNGEKIATTLVAPDFVIKHGRIESQFIYYKRFDKFKILEGVESSMPCKFMAVVIDAATQRVCTVYPTDRVKTGTREYKPEGDLR